MTSLDVSRAEDGCTLRACPGIPTGWFAAGPLIGLMLAVGVHGVGRLAAVGSPIRMDSIIYAVAAYRFYCDPAGPEVLVADKPGGQALWTGWVYLLGEHPPTRLSLVPLESACMLLGCGVFYLLSRRLFGSAWAAFLTLAVAIAENSYNALDSTTDGFNLSENYLLLPAVATAAAHLLAASPVRRGLLRGLAIGVALTLKQSAVVLLAVVVLDDLVRVLRRRADARSLAAIPWTLAGVALGILPLIAVLAMRGWLAVHWQHLLKLSEMHIGTAGRQWPLEAVFRPIVPLLCVMAWCGALTLGRGRLSRQVQPTQYGEIAFAMIWLAGEWAMVQVMVKPSTHYLQPIVLPLALCVGGVWRRAELGFVRRQDDDAIRARRWMFATTGMMLLYAVTPLLARASSCWLGYRRATEATDFAYWREHWMEQPLLEHLASPWTRGSP